MLSDIISRTIQKHKSRRQCDTINGEIFQLVKFGDHVAHDNCPLLVLYA